MTADALGRHPLFVHAHPDDETIVTGALLAWLAERGIDADVVTATRGEQGECTPAVGALSGEELVRHRERELAAAVATLGVARHAWLGTPPARAAGLAATRYADSGMRWLRPGLAGPAEDVAADAFTSVPLAAEAADLVALVRAWGTTALVTYADDGGYGHPDHVRAHHLCVAVARELGIPCYELVTAPAVDVAWVDASAHEDTLRRALACYASQLTVTPAGITHVGGQQEALTTEIGLRRVGA